MSATIQMSIIPASIQETLFKKMSMLEKSTTVTSRNKEEDDVTTANYEIGSSIAKGTKGPEQNYMMARTTWMRMVSMKFGPDNKPVILQGGEADEKGKFVSNVWGSKGLDFKFDTDIPFGDPGDVMTKPGEGIIVPGRYWTGGETQPFRPSPGIKDIRVEHKSMRTASTAPTRTTEINWICWTWQDLDRLTKHFLAPGVSIFVDWGWMGGKGTDLAEVVQYPLFEKTDDIITGWKENVNQITNNLSQHIVNQKGHYDAIVGQVYNFDWKVREDGGFDCNTQIIGKGSLIIDTLSNIRTDHLKSRLPNIIKSNTTETYERHYKKTQIIGKDDRVSVRAKSEEATWVLPIFAAEDFFKENTNTDYSGVYTKINQAKLKSVVHSTDPDIGGHAKQGTGTEQTLDVKPTFWSNTTETEYETVGKKPIGNDESLGAKGVSIVTTLDETKTGAKGGADNRHHFSNMKSIKLLYMKSNELLRALSPWITFDDYMEDIWNQVFEMMLVNPKFISSGNVIGIFDDMGARHIYVTWGWFEDNVISRFFGVLKDTNATDDKIIPGLSTEFRSYEDVIEKDANTNSDATESTHSEYYKKQVRKYKRKDWAADVDDPEFMAAWNDYAQWEGGTSDSVLPESGKLSCKTPAGQYVFTTDTSKFLIVDRNSMTADWVCENWGNGWSREGEAEYYHQFIAGSTFKSSPFGDFQDEAPTECDLATKNILKWFADGEDSTNGSIRNVYFNVDFLRHAMKEKSSIGHAIQEVWDAFSNEYASIFKFGLKYNTTEDRVMVYDKTWTQGSVRGMLGNKSRRMDPNAADGTPESVDKFDGLFEFPTWKRGSMVKSQNLSATLPSALKNQLALQNTNPNSHDVDKSDDLELVNKAKGVSHLIIPHYKDPGGAFEEGGSQDVDEAAQSRMSDALSGKVDFPYRNNRWFGSNSADITEPLSIGEAGEGIQLNGSILDSLIQAESFKYTNTRMIEGGEKVNEKMQNLVVSQAAQAAIDAKEALLKDFHNTIKDKKGLTLGGDSGFYEEFVREDSTSPLSSCWKLNSDVRGALNGLLKGPGGPGGQQDPLIPIDFDMDIDGIGGIFPGNAFASNYLPTRYKKQSCFQTLGVEHRVDSSNWTTTVKGQIRVDIHPPVEDTIDDDQWGTNFTMQERNPFSGIRFKLPSLPEDPTNWDDFMLDGMELDELPPLEDYSKLEEPPPPPEPVVDSTAVGTIDGKDATQAEIDTAMAAAAETLSAKEVESMTRAQAIQTFQDTLLSTLPAEFSWDTFLPVFDAIGDSASAVADPTQSAFAKMDMNKALMRLYGITGIRSGTTTVDGITRAAYQISFSNGQRTVGP